MHAIALQQASFSFAPPAPPPVRAVRSSGGGRREHHPLLVTLRSSATRWDLHGARSQAALRSAAAATRPLAGFHAFHVSVRGDDVHLLVEAESSAALARGLREFAAAAARGLARATGRLGPPFEEGFATRELRTLDEFRAALRSLIGPDRAAR